MGTRQRWHPHHHTIRALTADRAIRRIRSERIPSRRPPLFIALSLQGVRMRTSALHKHRRNSKRHVSMIVVREAAGRCTTAGDMVIAQTGSRRSYPCLGIGSSSMLEDAGVYPRSQGVCHVQGEIRTRSIAASRRCGSRFVVCQ